MQDGPYPRRSLSPQTPPPKKTHTHTHIRPRKILIYLSKPKMTFTNKMVAEKNSFTINTTQLIHTKYSNSEVLYKSLSLSPPLFFIVSILYSVPSSSSHLPLTFPTFSLSFRNISSVDPSIVSFTILNTIQGVS